MLIGFQNPVSETTPVTIESSLLTEIGLTKVNFKIANSEKNETLNDFQHESVVTFVAIEESDAKKIRKWVLHNSSSNQNINWLNKPKNRSKYI